MTPFLALRIPFATAVAARLLLLVRAVPAALRLLTRAVLHLLAPPACAACDAATRPDAVFCPACSATVAEALDAPRASPSASALDHGALLVVSAATDAARRGTDLRIAGDRDLAPLVVIAAGAYEGALGKAVRRLKYGGRPDLARALGRLLGAAVGPARPRIDVVVPVPLHPRKLRERGYNQAALLAGHVARAAGARLDARGLSRTRATAPQASLSRSDRLHNLTGAFRVRAPESVRGKRVLLVDDVATTGATLRACADALLASGAASVTAAVLARADAPIETREAKITAAGRALAAPLEDREASGRTPRPARADAAPRAVGACKKHHPPCGGPAADGKKRLLSTGEKRP